MALTLRPWKVISKSLQYSVRILKQLFIFLGNSFYYTDLLSFLKVVQLNLE